MSNKQNRFGLTRHIPEEIAREVRRRSGFGCIRCGVAICQYEHLDPPFAEASSHDPDGIVLLCGNCHERKTRGYLSIASIKKNQGNPKCKQVGFSFDNFDVGDQWPVVILGNYKCTYVDTILRVGGDEIFGVLPPEHHEGPFRINCRLSNSEGNVIFDMQDNIWRIASGVWDASVSGARVKIWRKQKDVSVELRVEPPRQIVVERILMAHRGFRIACQEGGDLNITHPNGGLFASSGLWIHGYRVGIDVNFFQLFCGVGGKSELVESGEPPFMRANSMTI